MKVIIMNIFMLLLLSGCATVGGMDRREADIKEIRSMYETIYIFEVPNTDTVISDTLLVATIKLASSKPSDDLLVYMQSISASDPIVVYSDSDAVAAATLERAMKDGIGTIDGKLVYFLGAEKYWESLTDVAKEAGVNLRFSNSTL
ncbi:hypothetical protein BGP77_15345 [Saccharospirillum sp. MSK14-1]|uniref:hypothetical protein n=1 Tax=Saccharospirillum sp. MSK14-1 TaxID=1897632 RepID=UPI000D383C1A|nr:hypothetical protein [Saccharospirillum sp. MSK14-1]PTY37846.1 hypothetical protein BGP77_15345 [Saccharospirillum sp. MSK14-1]